MRLLVVEDEPRLAASLAKGLRQASHVVDVAPGLGPARDRLATDHYDVIVLDVVLPDGSGFGFTQELRANGCHVPVLMLTARDSIEDQVRGFDHGADDYMVKPFALEELLARLRVLGRRGPRLEPELLEVGDLTINIGARTARRRTRAIELTTTEFALLEFLARRAGEFCTRAEISAEVWHDRQDALSNVIDVYIARLRKKLDAAGETPLLHTMRGTGYSLGPARA